MDDVDQNFLRDVSLWSIVGNTKNVNRLKVLCDFYLNSKSNSIKARMAPILFLGKRGSGRTVLAYANANS